MEAPDGSGNFEPDTSSGLFAGKTFTHKSGSSGTSNHAQQVATHLYGNPGSLVEGSCPVDLYGASNWISTVIRTGGIQAPALETRAVTNHSWISPRDSNTTNDATEDSQATESNKRLDFAINRDGFVCVVGANNGNTTVLPQLWQQAYHPISVGLVNGAHSAGFTALDTTGRIKPDIVAPDGATSFATPMVGSAAAVLVSKLASIQPGLAAADRPKLVKALLMATARKDTVASWENSATRPLDLRYGSGELNILHAYNALRAGGSAAPSDTTECGPRGWSVASVSSTTPRSYYFNLPAGAPSQPFCAALAWHRTVTQAGFNWNASLANLKLRLYSADGFTPVSVISESDSAVDNVELVNQGALPPGEYLLRVESSQTTSTGYALAWHSLPVVTVTATQADAQEDGSQNGAFTISRSGDSTFPLPVPLVTGGAALTGTDYQALPSSVMIPAGQSSVTVEVVPLPESATEGDREVTLAVGADFGLVRDVAQIATVTIHEVEEEEPHVPPFEQWRGGHFTGEELADAGVSGPAADPDADGMVNLIEYALGLEPKTPDAVQLLPGDSEGHLALAVVKNPAATDLEWMAEVSGDLEEWENGEILVNDGMSFEARDPVIGTGEEKRFIRLKVVLVR